MDSPNTKIKSKRTVNGKALLLCMVFLFFSQMMSSAQITASLFTLSTTDQRTTISVDFKKVPLAEALQTLARKVNVGISYATVTVPAKRITYRAEETSIFKILDDILKDTGLQSTLSQDRKVIMIKKKPALKAVQQSTITGKVTDAGTGQTLPGVNIAVKGTTTGTSTDADGQYELTVESLQDTLVFSYVGYATKTVPINGRTSIDVGLNTSSKALSEMVVVAFGKQEERNIVGSISSIDSQDIRTSTTETVSQNLQGKSAGVQVNSSSGVLGAPVSVRVRGTTSINASSQPLFVVDGIPLISNGIGENLGQSVNPLINLNSSNIESMEVLKDASATALYGSRGANGVVLITTKDGNAGNTQLNIGISGGFTHPTNSFDLMSGKEWAEMYNYKVGEDVFGTQYPAPSEVPNTRWWDLVTRTGSVQNYTASISGGSSATQFFFSGAFNNQESWAIPNSLKKYDILAKINHKFNEELTLGISIDPSRSVGSRIATSNAVTSPGFSNQVSPVVPQFLPNGEINDGKSQKEPLNDFTFFAGTPYGNSIGVHRKSVTTQINSNVHAAYDFIPKLTLKTQLNLQFLQNEETVKRNDFTNEGYPSGKGHARNEQYLNWSWRNTLQFNSDWKKNSLTALVGVTFQEQDYSALNVAGNTYVANELRNLNSASNIFGGGGSGTSFAFQNNLARITYTYNDRYILTLNGSYNGSSRFGKSNNYGFFPAAAVGWILSDEKFAQTDWIRFLKLRLSYGEVGNANINNFQHLALLGSGYNYNNNSGLVLNQLASPDLSWESTKQFDIGLDYGFLNNRVKGSIGYYIKNTNDLLINVPVSSTNGFSSVIRNEGSIKNSGIEFDITADIINNSNFTWSISGNISTLHNEVTKIPSSFINISHLVKEGQPLGVFYLRDYAGVNPNNGDALYYLNSTPSQSQIDNKTVFKIDKFGDEYVTNNYNSASRKIVGSPFPDYYGGFGTSLTYKGIDASLDFQFTEGKDIFWATGTYTNTNQGTVYNQVRSQLDYWTPNNKNATVPEPRTGTNGQQRSTRYLKDASYLRLKNATIGYTIPSNFLNGYKLRLYIQGTNLMTFTDFPGMDPEVVDSTNDNVLQGRSSLQLPQARTILFGLKLGL